MQRLTCVAVIFSTAATKVYGGHLKGGPTHHSSLPILTSPLNCTCPDTYALIGDRCERAVQFAQETTCPAGFILSDSTCRRQTPPDETCPYGYARVQNQCVQRSVTLPTLGCSGNYTLEATTNWGRHEEALVCTARIPVATALECPDGTPYRGLCTTTTTTTASYSCPAGFADIGNNACNRIAPVDCRTAHLRRLNAVDAGWNQEIATAAQFGSPNKAHGVNTWRTWHGDHHHHYDASRSVLSAAETCTTNVTITATPFCPSGTLRGNLCAVETPAEPVAVCPAFGTPSDCFAIDREGPQSTCPAGYNQECGLIESGRRSTLDCDCVQISTQPVSLICPPGFTFEDGLCTDTAATVTACPANSIQVNDACQRLETSPAICTYSVEFACLGEGCTSNAGHTTPHGGGSGHVGQLLSSVANVLAAGRTAHPAPGTHQHNNVPFSIFPAGLHPG